MNSGSIPGGKPEVAMSVMPYVLMNSEISELPGLHLRQSRSEVCHRSFPTRTHLGSLP